MQALDQDQPIFSFRTLDEAIAQNASIIGVFSTLFGVFAVVALVLSVGRSVRRDGLFSHAADAGDRRPDGARCRRGPGGVDGAQARAARSSRLDLTIGLAGAVVSAAGCSAPGPGETERSGVVRGITSFS